MTDNGLKAPHFRFYVLMRFCQFFADTLFLSGFSWLAVKSTDSQASVSVLIALVAVPRVLLLLLGGAMVDRIGGKKILAYAHGAASIALATIIGLLVLNQQISYLVIYLLCIVMGASSAFSMPASSAYLPQVLPGALLQKANAFTMFMVQISMIVGAILSTRLISVYSTDDMAASGIAAYPGAVLLMCCFIAHCVAGCSIFGLKNALHATSEDSQLKNEKPKPAKQKISKSIADTFGVLREDKALRQVFIYVSLIAFLINGPLSVLLPSFAANDLASSADAYGTLLAALSAGTLAGMLISGLVKFKYSAGAMLLMADMIAGVLMLVMAFLANMVAGAVLMVIIGLALGMSQVVYISAIQQRVPKAALGSTMSIFQLSNFGGRPLAALIAGVMLHWLSATQLMITLGGILFVVSVLALIKSDIPNVSQVQPQG